MFSTLNKESISFYQWMLENWTIEGGLIPQATAARLMRVSKARVTQMIKEGKLREIRFENQVFVPYGSTMNYARKKEYQEIKLKLEKEFKALRSSTSAEDIKDLQHFEDGIKKTIESAEEIVKNRE